MWKVPPVKVTAIGEVSSKDVTATGTVTGESGMVTMVQVNDYGGGFANYTPPAGVEGMVIVAVDTNTTTPGKRLYVYANGSWSYVELT